MRNNSRNPFQYGRELQPTELVDRQAELDEILRVIQNRGKLFVIGPRRFGKTSLLAAAGERAAASGVMVLRFDAEKYESLNALAQGLLTGAARGLAGPLERVAKLFGEAARRLKPELGIDPNTGSLSVSLGAGASHAELPTLVDALDAIEQLAIKADREITVMLDEVQEIVVEHGLPAEKQLRAVVQRHTRVSYIFAGSSTRLLTQMTSDSDRPFYRLGGRMYVDRIPRAEFLDFLRRGFGDSVALVDIGACERILTQADEVPYNVQRLAYELWELLRSGEEPELSVAAVDRAVTAIVTRDDPAYTQLWTSLTKNQKKALKAVVDDEGERLLSASVTGAYGLSASSMQRALEALLERNLTRAVQESGFTRYVLVDPFLGAWLRTVQDL